MEVEQALIADGANTTADGKLNVLGAFRNIRASNFPATHPTLTLILGFSADPVERGTTKSIEVKLVDADGKQLLGINGNLHVPTPTEGSRTIEWWNQFRIDGLKFEQPGDYAFVVLIGGETKKRVPLLVALIETTPPSLPPPAE